MSAEIVQSLAAMVKSGLMAKDFSTGSKGFFTSEKILTTDGDHYQSQAQAILIGSKENPKVKAKAAVADVATEIIGLIPSEPPLRTFKSGKTGYRMQGKVEIGAERYQVAVQAVKIG